jgi:hypothetical protein
MRRASIDVPALGLEDIRVSLLGREEGYSSMVFAALHESVVGRPLRCASRSIAPRTFGLARTSIGPQLIGKNAAPQGSAAPCEIS